MTRNNPIVIRYTPVPGSHLSARDAQAVGEAIAELTGDPTDLGAEAEQVAEVAKDPKSPLHRYVYDCDEKTAARRYYVDRARCVLRAVAVTFISPETKRPIQVRQTECVKGRYIQVTDIMKDKKLKGHLLVEAKKSLESWVRKYEYLNELASVRGSIRKHLEKL